MVSLHPFEKKILLSMRGVDFASPDEIAARTGLEMNAVMRSLDWLSAKRLVKIDESFEEYISLGREGLEYAEKGLPERRAAELLKNQPRREANIAELKKELQDETSIAIGWLIKKKQGVPSKGVMGLINTDKNGEVPETSDEKLLKILTEEGRPMTSTDILLKLPDANEVDKAIKWLASRKDVIAVEERVRRSVSLTEEGVGILSESLEPEDSIGQLTHEIIKNGGWRGKKFRGYDESAEVAPALPAKLHPLTRMIDEITEIFISMGFTGIEGPIVESAFWNFDALFVPQDHPAREMQDTFYLERPSKAALPDREMVSSISSVHKDGGSAKSDGWGYEWDKNLASQTLLRTHTTSTTIRHLAKREPLPIKVFSIGRVFRKERMSYKHLPEFHQIEGIVVGDVNFSNLLAILREFYARMGFERIRFRPAYFPYTEPSLEVEVYFEKKQTWIELGGAGIFRPEVYLPLGVEHPVLAWGLGLERLAMLRLGLTDIRVLYRSDIDWLRSLSLH